MDLNASTSKVQNSATMSPNFVTIILLKSTSKCPSNDMLIIFFGYMVVKISIMEDCFPHVKYNQNLIEFDQNCIFHEFSMDLNAPTSKIQISLNKSPKIMTQILLKSTYDGLSNDILIIFFGYVVAKNFIIEDCIPTLTYY